MTTILNEPGTSDPEPVPEAAATVVTGADPEPERRRISDYLGDVSRLEAELATERTQNLELRAEIIYQRRRIEREEEARLQLMQLLDNSQRLLGNAQRHTQHLLGGNESEIFTLALPPGKEGPAQEASRAEAPAARKARTRRRWWSRG